MQSNASGVRRRLLHAAHEDALADATGLDPCAHGDDLPTAVGALDAREFQRLARPGGIVVIRGGKAARRAVVGLPAHRLGVPADPGVDVGVVHRRRADPDQDLAAPGFGHLQVVPVLQPVQAAMPC